MAVLMQKTKSGKEYYAQDMGGGRLRATDKKADGNATSLGNHRWLQTGGIMVLTTKTEKELKERREARRTKRKEVKAALIESVRKKLIAHPDREFTAAFLKAQEKRVSQVAGKTMRKQVKAEERAKAILEKAGLKATIQKK